MTGVAEQASMISCQPSPVAERKRSSSAWKPESSLCQESLQPPEGMSGNCCACVSLNPLSVEFSQTPERRERSRVESMTNVSHLHANHSVDEENDGNEGGHPGQGLEWLDKGEKQGSDSVPFWEQFHYSEDAEKTKEGNRYHVSWLEKERYNAKIILERLTRSWLMQISTRDPITIRKSKEFQGSRK